MDKHKEDMLRKYLDRELDEEQERRVLHMIADDPEMRSMLHFERQAHAIYTQSKVKNDFRVPEGFSDKVMANIETHKKEPGVADKLNTYFQSLWTPAQVQLRPAYALILLLIIAIVSMLPMYLATPGQQAISEGTQPSIEQASENGEQVWTRFVYIDNEADSIGIAGDFNNWEPTQLIKKNVNGNQIWTALIPMQRGEHRYMFVKNGQQWVTDPMAPMQQDDGFGNKNAVIYL